MVPFEQRIPPIDPETATDEQKALLNGWWKDLNFSKVMAQHPKLYQVYVPVIAKVIAQTDLPPRDRQILVMRTLANHQSDIYNSWRDFEKECYPFLDKPVEIIVGMDGI